MLHHAVLCGVQSCIVLHCVVHRFISTTVHFAAMPRVVLCDVQRCIVLAAKEGYQLPELPPMRYMPTEFKYNPVVINLFPQ